MKSNQVIINWVNKDTSILDLGCGDGSILEILSLEKNVKGLGVEIDPKNIHLRETISKKYTFSRHGHLQEI